ncbi:hypothetical protein LTR15_005583 [Elasticomyces elasticus]|nr:hypothetical protein LTR15_005583 [Elasticomyces elasticus]
MSQPTNWTRYVRTYLFSDLKPMRYSTYSGWFGEAEGFQKFEDAHIAIIRNFEGAAVDGEIVVKAPSSGPALPLGWSSSVERLRWAQVQEDVQYASIDMKFIALLPMARSARAYHYSNPHSTDTGAQVTDLMVLVLEGVQNYVALVPPAVWLASRDIGYGIEPLITLVPTWVYPFMVADKHLKAAVEAMCAVMRGEVDVYVNPTTGVQFHTWQPTTRHKLPPALPANNSWWEGSYDAIWELWQLLERVGYKAHLCPIQPLICDFLLELHLHDSVPMLLACEHKSFSSHGLSTGRRSPFAARRQWHFLFLHDSKLGVVWCFARQHVREEWSHKSWLNKEHLEGHRYALDDEGLTALDEYVRSTAEAAVEEVQRIVKLWASESDVTEDDLDQILTSNWRRPPEVPTAGLVDKLPSRAFSDRSLPWLCHHLNTLCAQMREMVCFPLDPLHSRGDHLLVDVDWPPALAARFLEGDQQGVLPAHAFSLAIRNKRSIVLSFLDMSPDRSEVDAAYPLFIRKEHVRRPAVEKHFLYCGSIDARVTREVEQSSRQPLAPTIMLMPSEFTSIFEQGLRKEKRVDDRASAYFRKDDSLQSDTAGMWPAGATHPQKLIQGGFFMSKKHPEINPLRYILDGRSTEEGSFWHNLRRILKEPGPASIVSIPGTRNNQEFGTEKYITDPMDVHQDAWNHGLTRTPASLGGAMAHSGGRTRKAEASR